MGIAEKQENRFNIIQKQKYLIFHHKIAQKQLFKQASNMKQQLEKRLTELKAEFASGQKVLADLETKQANVRETLLRIQGAIQVLEEELAKNNGAACEPEKVEVLETEEVET